MTRRVRSLFACALVALSCAAPNAADAVNLVPVATLSPVSSGPIAFTVTDESTAALAGSQSFYFNAAVATTSLVGTGSISLSLPTITGAGGGSISATAFKATCTLSGTDSGGTFVSAAQVTLAAASTPVPCATVTSNVLATSSTFTFYVTLVLDDRTGPTAFAADSYATTPLTVTLTAT